MDGENNGKPYEQMDDLGGFPIFLETPIYISLFMKNHSSTPLGLEKNTCKITLFESTLHVTCVFFWDG